MKLHLLLLLSSLKVGEETSLDNDGRPPSVVRLPCLVEDAVAEYTELDNCSSCSVSPSRASNSSRETPGGGRLGKDLFNPSLAGTGFLLAFLFFLRRAMRLSWQLMQKIPCDVRAYRRLSIFRLQLRQRKQLAQNA
jgi:hypothetical protein